MTSVCYMPAGYEDSEDDIYGGYYMEETKKSPQKSEIEIFKSNLMKYLKENNVENLRNELDKRTSDGAAFDIDEPIEGSWNLLFHACYEGFLEIVEFLIYERNANVSTITDFDGFTTLMIACSSREASEEIVMKIIKQLLEKDPQMVHKSNVKGETALMIAAKNGFAMAIDYLHSLEADLDIVNNLGRNALFYAIEGKHVGIVQKLLELRIDYTIQDYHGDTAKSFAQANLSCPEIISLFPPEKYKYETPSAYFSYNTIDSIIPDTRAIRSKSSSINGKCDNEAQPPPPFFPDIVCMLRGMEFEKFIPLFSKANISLEEFLTIDEKRLEDIGVDLPYQRKMILGALQKFFSEKWNNKSVWLPTGIKAHITPVDLVYILANLLRQIIVTKSQLQYILNNADRHQQQISHEPLEEFQNRIKELRRLLNGLKKTKRPLLIPKQKQSIQCNIDDDDWYPQRLKKNAIIIVPVIILLSATAIKLLYRK